jgi:hypothetical protein
MVIYPINMDDILGFNGIKALNNILFFNFYCKNSFVLKIRPETSNLHLDADGPEPVGRAAVADHLCQVKVERLRHRAQVRQHEPLDVGVGHLDRVVELLQPLLRQVSLIETKNSFQLETTIIIIVRSL